MTITKQKSAYAIENDARRYATDDDLRARVDFMDGITVKAQNATRQICKAAGLSDDKVAAVTAAMLLKEIAALMQSGKVADKREILNTLKSFEETVNYMLSNQEIPEEVMQWLEPKTTKN